jgi:hypothetical protein
MHLVEQLMKVLKGYICFVAQPKGSMVEGYVLEEILDL